MDSILLVMGDDNGEIRIWNVLNGEFFYLCVLFLEEGVVIYGGWVIDFCFFLDGKMFIFVGGYIKWWNVVIGEFL